jgi:hypothetical protein
MYETTRKEKYIATRKHYPLRSAREILAALRERASWIKNYRPCGYVYNPPSEGTQIRWIEDTEKAGLRFMGYADDIINLRHTGWMTDPYGDTDEVIRGAVWQLPARHGFPQYVAGYCDPCNEGAARIDFDVIDGPRGGEDGGAMYGTSDELAQAARYADGLAEHTAEDEREYRAKDYAEQRAGELRDEAAELRADLCDIIRSQREKISELLREAADVEENPWQLFS